MTSPVRTKVAAAVTIAALAGLTGIALTSGSEKAAQPVASPAGPAPQEVQTKVIRRTIHRVRREKPAPSGAAAAQQPTVVPAVGPAPAARSTAVRSSPVSVPVSTAPAEPVSPPAATRPSGSDGEDHDEYENENEYEDHDDEGDYEDDEGEYEADD